MPIQQLKIQSGEQGWRKEKYGNFRSKKISDKNAKKQENQKTTKPFKKKLKSVWYATGGRREKPERKIFRCCFLVFLWLAVFCVLSGSIAGFLALAYFSQDLPNPDKIIERELAQSTKIYDRTGETLLYEVHGDEKRTLVELEDIPEYVKWATIVVEDKDFYTHKGFKITSIIRAALMNIIKGGKIQGASTLTQQFVKNAVLTPEKKYTRKIKELILSYQIEKRFSKDQILKMYFNEIPYGGTVYGIEAAAETFFGKTARELDIAEAALLASLPQAPTYYSPFGSHKEELFARQKFIINTLFVEGYIDRIQKDRALEEKLEFNIKKEKITAPHFVMYIREILTEKFGSQMAEKGGLKVYTTLDLDKQRIAEEVVEKWGKINEEKYGAKNAALVSIDPKTGQILAMVGSRDYFDMKNDGNVNVTIRPRPPGSSLKPLVYAAAFQKGYTPQTVLYDVVTNFAARGDDYEPHDYDDKERGPISMKKALAGSLNIPAVKTLYLVGVDNVIKLAQKFGYTTLTDPGRYGLSLVLGGADVKLLEHTAAYGAFSQEGILHPYAGILKIEDENGRIIEEWKDQEIRVMDKQTTRLITDILSDNEARAYIFGINNHLILKDRPVAAKTGTTNDYRDGWTIGYTPSLVAGVWVGNNDNSVMGKKADGSNVAAPIWQEFMATALKDTAGEEFTPPEEIKTEKPILRGEGMGEIKIKIDRASGKLATEYTPESFIEEKVYQFHHSILHFINKNNPLGPAPDNPSSDPQYELWEQGIQNWLTKKEKEEGIEYVGEEPPIEYDDLHLPDNRPSATILYPQNNGEIRDPSLTVQIHADAPRGVSRVEYFIDDKWIRNSTGAPFALINFPLGGIGNGFHTLKAVVYDDIDNSQSIQITLNVIKPQEPINISWVSPKNNAAFYVSNFPLILSAFINKPDEIENISFYSQNTETKELANLKTIASLSGSLIVINWDKKPSPGNYRLYAVAGTVKGETITGEEILVRILGN